MTPQNSSAAYLRTKVLSASPEELRLMLLEGAVKFARQGREGLEAKDYHTSFTGFSQARAIVMELMSSMRPEIDKELCDRLSGLYTFLYLQLVQAGHEKSTQKADRAIELLEYEAQTWRLLMEKVEVEAAAGAAARDTLRAATAGSQPLAEPTRHAGLSVRA